MTQIQSIDIQTGGRMDVILPTPEGPRALNQTSLHTAYVLAKLVQPGIASLDLTLEQKDDTGFTAQVSPQELQLFKEGPAEVEITT